MFKSITLRGDAGEILFGYRPAAVLRGWIVVRQDYQWSLRAAVTAHDPFQLQRQPLLFTAWPGRRNDPKGRWCFPVLPPIRVEGTLLTARLGPPEH